MGLTESAIGTACVADGMTSISVLRPCGAQTAVATRDKVTADRATKCLPGNVHIHTL